MNIRNRKEMSKANAINLSSLLRNCFALSAINQSKQIHAQILVNGFILDPTIQTDLILAYARCSHLQDAQQVFDRMTDPSMHSWNILISSYVRKSLHFKSLSLLQRFLDTGLQPDHFTLPSVLKACAGLKDTWFGKKLHSWVIKLGFEEHVIVGSSLLDFYLKCEHVIDARDIFVEMPHRDVVAYNSMITGFGRVGFAVEALNYFRQMLKESIEMDTRTIPSILNACGREGDLIRGKEIHGQVLKNQVFIRDVAIGNSLIDMYAKCGCLEASKNIFRKMPELSLVTWTTLISCYGVHGKGQESLMIFNNMIASGLKPNCVTFTAVLASCSHSGIINQGRLIFKSMSSNYGIEPSVEHYACMVDLLGRLGHLEEALQLIEEMPQKSTSSIWGALLGACRIHKNIEIGEVAAYQLFELEPRNSSNYIAICTIYESLGRWNDVSRIRSRMRELGLVKAPGCSWINIKGRVYRFFRGDIIHPKMKMAYETLDGMIKIMSTESCG